MVGGPEGDFVGDAVIEPFPTAGEVGLDGDTLDVGHAGEELEGVLVATEVEGFTPGGEEDTEAPFFGLAAGPSDEAGEGELVGAVVGGGVVLFGEGAIPTAVIATGEGAAVEDAE